MFKAVFIGLILFSCQFFQMFFFKTWDTWRAQIFYGFSFFIFYLVAQIYKKIGFLYSISILYFVISGLYCAFFPVSIYAKYGKLAINVFEAVSNAGFVYFLVLIFTFIIIKREHIEKLFSAFSALCIIDSIFIILKYGFDIKIFTLMNNTAIDGSFVAIVYPLIAIRPLAKRYDFSNIKEKLHYLFSDIFFITVPIVAVLISKSATAYLCIVAILVCVCFRHLKKYNAIPVIVSLVAISIILGHSLMGVGFFESSGRIYAWTLCLDYFNHNINVLLGAGMSSFYFYGPKILADAGHQNPNAWLFAHNDFFQVMFEHGRMGLVLVILIVIKNLRETYKNTWLFCSFVAYFMCGLTQAPLRYFLFSVFGLLLIKTQLLLKYDK